MNLTKYIAGCFMVGSMTLGVISCQDVFENLEDHSPEWLGDNIYDYLQKRGDCNYYVRLIDDCGLTEVMRRTGSNTLFFTRDEAFDKYFSDNKVKGTGPTCYEEMPQSLKQMFISLGRISNAQLIERLCHGDISGTVLRRSTYFNSTDTIPVFKKADLLATFNQNPYFMKLNEDTVRMLTDASTTTLTQFFPDVLNELGITGHDVDFITNGAASGESASLYDNKIIKQDITCKNGYLHELDGLILPPETMAGYINNADNVSEFRNLMNRFAIPVVFKEATSTTPRVYTLRYFNEHPENKSNHEVNLYGALMVDEDGNDKSNACLYFDPAWNAYQPKATNANSTEPACQGDMGVMLAPTNEAMEDYFRIGGEGEDLFKSFGSWENVPDNIVADFVKNHQLYSFLASLPHNFDILKDEAGYDMELSEADIVDKYVARNGVVYTVNKVFPPLDYRSVMGPAKIDQANQIFNIAMNESHTQFMYYLRSLLSCYQFFITPDECLGHYVDPVSMGKSTAEHAYWKFTLNQMNDIQATVYSLETSDSINVVTDSKIIKNRFNDILRSHTLVVGSNQEFEAAVAGGQEYFVTMGYMPIRIKGTKAGAEMSGCGNTDENGHGINGNTTIHITDASEKSNGTSYIVDGLIQNTLTSTYQNLNQSTNSEVINSQSPFYEFLRLCNACGIFSNSATASVIPLDPYITFLQQYDYTLYIPENELLREAMNKHYIPTPDELQELYELSAGGLETHIDSLYNIAVDKLRRFIRYHIQDNSVFIKGKKESNAEYLTETIDNTTKLFYPVYITNTGDAMSIRDNIGQTANVNVSEGLYNLIGRDIRVNNSTGSTSSPDISKSTTIDSYSCTVVHQIDNVLWFEQPSAQWHTDLYKDLEDYLNSQQ